MFSEQIGRRVLAGVARLALVLSALPMLSEAQSASAKKPTSLVSINPLGLPFKWVSGESESKLTNMATLGGSISWLDIGDGSYLSAEAKFRLYPNEEAFKGFSIGVAGGVAHLSEEFTDDNSSTTRPTIAVIADYNWLLGKNKKFLVGTGVGAKRIFGSDSEFSDINFAYPTARFQIGVLF